MQSQVGDLLHLLGYSALYPPQELAMSKGLMDGKNMLVTTPTASGKSLIGLMGAIRALNDGKKVVYLTPLRALAMEKFSEFRTLQRLQIYDHREIRLSISTGDYDSPGSKLVGADVVMLTNEKLDSIMRHGVNWLDDVGLFIIDEVHLIGDRERGPTLEIILTKIKETYPKAQIIALSATISNSEEVGRWLGCEVIETNWRPTKLIEGIYDYGRVRMNDNISFEVEQSGSTSSTAAIDLALQSVMDGGQALIFAETRRRAVSLAAKAAEQFTKFYKNPAENLAQNASLQVLDNGDADINKTLSGLIAKGVAFHHAGLGPKVRGIVESAFKSGIVKVLTATPTLGAGVNLPARRVVIASIFRYDQEYGGNVPMTILEYKQLCGRAGRPAYDKFGESIIISDSRIDSSELYDHYVLGTPEPLRSQLMNERALRIHLLGSISSMSKIKKSKLYGLFNHTFFARYRDEQCVNSKLQSVIEYLEREGLVNSSNHYLTATKFGKRTSLLYIDPQTSVQFRENIKSFQARSKFEYNDYVGHFLNWVVQANDFYPKLSLRSKEIKLGSTFFSSHEWNLYHELIEMSNSRSLVALLKWVDEANERTLADTIGVEPGDMYRMVETAEWLLYSLGEIAKLFRIRNIVHEIQILKLRMKFGIKTELIPLIHFEGVGRIRARALYNTGITNGEKLAEASESKLAAISKIGPALAKKLKDQVNQKK
jgi:helicase